MHLFHQVKMSLLDKKDVDFGKCCVKPARKLFYEPFQIPKKYSVFKANSPCFQVQRNITVTVFDSFSPGNRGNGRKAVPTVSRDRAPNSPENSLVDKKDALFRPGSEGPLRGQIEKIL